MKDIDALNKSRLIQAGAAHVLPLIQRRKDSALARMIGNYKSGERDFIGEVAELAVINDIMNELKQNESKLSNLEERQANERSK